MTATVTLTFNRETKRAFRYDVPPAASTGPVPYGSLYLDKTQVEGKPPTVTVIVETK